MLKIQKVKQNVDFEMVFSIFLKQTVVFNDVKIHEFPYLIPTSLPGLSPDIKLANWLAG